MHIFVGVLVEQFDVRFVGIVLDDLYSGRDLERAVIALRIAQGDVEVVEAVENAFPHLPIRWGQGDGARFGRGAATATAEADGSRKQKFRLQGGRIVPFTDSGQIT